MGPRSRSTTHGSRINDDQAWSQKHFHQVLGFDGLVHSGGCGGTGVLRLVTDAHVVLLRAFHNYIEAPLALQVFQILQRDCRTYIA